MYGQYKKRYVTYLTKKQGQKLDLLIMDSEEKQAEYLRNIIIEHLNKNNELIKSLENNKVKNV